MLNAGAQPHEKFSTKPWVDTVLAIRAIASSLATSIHKVLEDWVMAVLQSACAKKTSPVPWQWCSTGRHAWFCAKVAASTTDLPECAVPPLLTDVSPSLSSLPSGSGSLPSGSESESESSTASITAPPSSSMSSSEEQVFAVPVGDPVGDPDPALADC